MSADDKAAAAWDDYVSQQQEEKIEELERELNAASKERDDALMMLGMYRMKSDEQNQRIKRLEEAGDRMERWCSDWDAASHWEKAKEAKL